MIFNSTSIEGAFQVEIEPIVDSRGFFSRIFCSKEFSDLSLNSTWRQINSSFNSEKGTLRGLHMQIGKYSEVKLIKCIRGSIWDVFVDLRPTSTTFSKWWGCELNTHNRKMLYVPKGCAHGFITLEENTEIIYFVSSDYYPLAERSLIWNDCDIKINWPIKPVHISEKDQKAFKFNDLKNKLNSNY